MHFKTPNTFHKCRCGRDVLLEYIDEVKTCPGCGKQVQFPELIKKYLIAKYVERKKDSEIKIDGLVIKPIQHIKLD